LDTCLLLRLGCGLRCGCSSFGRLGFLGLLHQLRLGARERQALHLCRISCGTTREGGFLSGSGLHGLALRL
jgi:hypothetical protein